MATHPIQGQDPENPVNTKRTIPSGPGLPAFWSNDMDRALAYLDVHQCEYEKMVPKLKTWFPQLTNVSFPLFLLVASSLQHDPAMFSAHTDTWYRSSLPELA